MHYKQHWLNWRIAIVEARELSLTAKGLALYLNTYMNDRHDTAWPSISTICGDMNTTNKTVVKYIAELAEKGYLIKEKRFSNSTIYHANIPRSVEATLMEDLHRRSVGSTPTVVEDLHSNKQVNKQKNKQCAKFEEFWRVCPRKDNKKKAEVAFKSLSVKNQDKAIADYPLRYKETDKKFIPYPTTYIHGERWDDEIEFKSTSADPLSGCI